MGYPQFCDMRRRLWNASPCGVEYLLKKPPCWEYGTLFIFPDDSDSCNVGVAFGDLVMRVNAIELAQLCTIASGRKGEG